MTRAEHGWKVGDPVVITPDLNRRGGAHGTVVKVGRKLLTVGEGWQARRFRLDDDMREDTDGCGGYCHARTPMQHLAWMRRKAALESLTAVTEGAARWNWKESLTVEQMDAIVAIIKGATL